MWLYLNVIWVIVYVLKTQLAKSNPTMAKPCHKIYADMRIIFQSIPIPTSVKEWSILSFFGSLSLDWVVY